MATQLLVLPSINSSK